MGTVARLAAVALCFVSAVAAIVCPNEYNAGTTQCIESNGRCFLGYRWTGSTCILTYCRTGQVWLNSQAACGIPVCPAGYVYTSTAKQCTVSTTCTGGQIFSTSLNSCVCPINTYWNTATSTCVAGNCPVGYTRDAAGRCIDRNECTQAGVCGCCGTCVNTAGSFQCRCNGATTAQVTGCSCPARIRKEWRSLTLTEKNTFKDAIKRLISTGTYRAVVPYHEHWAVPVYGHLSNGFLPWHRWFVYLFENQLRSLGGSFGCIAVPYWDWTADLKSDPNAVPWISVVQEMGGTGSGCILDSMFGYYRYPPNNCVSRPFGMGWRPPAPTEVSSGLLNTYDFTSMTKLVKGWHGLIHDYVGAYGGTMMDTVYSPNDPIFWLHHSNVDRQWYQWQKCMGYQGVAPSSIPSSWYAPDFSQPVDQGFDTPMPAFPTSVTPRSVNSIRALGYAYARSSFTGSWDVDNVCTAVRRRRANDNPPATPATTNTNNIVPGQGQPPAFSNAGGKPNSGTENGGVAAALGLGQKDKSKDADEATAQAFAKAKTDQFYAFAMVTKDLPPGLTMAPQNANPKSAIGAKLAIAAAAECAFWGKYKPLSPEWAKMLGLTGSTLPCQS